MTKGSNNQYIQEKSENPQNEVFQKRNNITAQKIAKQFNIGRATVERAEYFVDGLNAAEEVSPGFKTAILSGEVKAPKSTIAEICKMEPEEKKKTIESILNAKNKWTILVHLFRLEIDSKRPGSDTGSFTM